MKSLIKYLRDHSIQVLGHDNSTITVSEVYVDKYGNTIEENLTLEADIDIIRDWLGY